MSQLSWKHHTLVQALLSRGPLPEKEVHAIFYGVSGKHPDSHSPLFNDYLLKINKELGCIQFELRGCRNQYDGKIYYGIVNNVADEQSKLGSKYSVPQITFYKCIIEAIMQDATAQGCISNIDAFNIRLENQVQAHQSSQDGSQSHVPPALKNFSFSQKEKTLSDLVRDGWLCSHSNGKFGLGTRSFLDLRSWFRSNDVPSCEVCSEAGVKADLCPKEDCTVRIHHYCLKQIFKRKAARVCPGCGTPWNASGDEENNDDDGGNDPSTSQAPSPGWASKRPRTCKAEAVEAAQAGAQTQHNAHTLRKKLRSCKAEAVNADETGTGTQPVLRRSQRAGLRNR